MGSFGIVFTILCLVLALPIAAIVWVLSFRLVVEQIQELKDFLEDRKE
jgi:hypothetical protein